MNFDLEKMFGYPVLRDVAPEEDHATLDYPKRAFQPDVSVTRDVREKSSAKLSYEIDHPVPELKVLIEEGKAEYRLNVNCPSTYHSENHRIGVEGELELDGSKLRNQIEIMVVLVSTQDLEYFSECWNADYGNAPIPIEANSILAWHSPFSYNVERERFMTSRALIDFFIDESLSDGETTFDGSEDYVKVGVNEKTHRAILSAERNESFKESVVSSIYHGIVMEMLVEMIAILEDEDGGDVSALRWTSVIEDKCREKGINWNEKSRLSASAQALLGNVFKSLTGHWAGAIR